MKILPSNMHDVILKCFDGVVVEAMYNEFGNHVI